MLQTIVECRKDKKVIRYSHEEEIILTNLIIFYKEKK